MVEGATEFRKNGFNDEDSAQLAQVSAMFQNVADEEMSAGESASFLISQLIAFNQNTGDVAGNAKHIADAINEVANNFSVGTGDLATGLKIVASTSSAMGNSLEETIGMLTAITEQTKNSSKASRGLNSIMASLAQILDPASSNGKKLVDIFTQLDIEMYDANGQFKTGYELLSGLAGVWDTLDTNSQKYIATTLAGTNQLNNFLALMNNFGHAVDATNTALESQGSAMDENAAYMESLESKLNALKEAWQELSNTIVDSELVKMVLDFATAVLQLANTDIGKFVSQFLLLTGVGWGASQLLRVSNLIGAVGSQFTTFASIVSKGLGVTAQGLGAAAGASGLFTTALSGALPVIMGIAAVLAVGGIVWKATEDYRKTTEQLGEEINNNNNEIDTAKQKLQDLNDIQWFDRTPEIQAEIDELNDYIDELEETNEKLEKINKKKYKKELETKYQYVTKYTIQGTGYTPSGQEINISALSEIDAVRQLNELLGTTYTSLQEVREQTNLTASEIAGMEVTTADVYTGYIDELTQLNIKLKNNGTLTEEEQRRYVELKGILSDYVVKVEAGTEAGADFGDVTKENYEKANILMNSIDNVTEALRRNDESTNLTAAQIQELVATYPALANVLEVVDGKYQTNISTLREYAQAEYDAARATGKSEQEALDATRTAVIERIKLRKQELTSIIRDLNAKQISARGPSGVATAESSLLFEQMGYVQQQVNELDAAYQELFTDEFVKDITGGITVTGDETKTGSKTTEKQKTALELLEEEWKKYFALLKDQYSFLEKSNASEEDQIAHLLKIQQALHEYANKFRAMGLSEDSEQVRELKNLWWDYENSISDIYDQIEERAKEAAEKTRQAWQESLEKQKSDYETAARYVQDMFQDELDKLQELRTETTQYYDDKIQALKDTNSELEDQIKYEELLNKLAQAKDKRLYVFKDGQFQYIQDVEEISSAQAELDAYNRDKALNQEVENLEKSKEEALADIDAQIEGWEQYQEEWKDVVNQYTKQQNKLIAEQVFGIDLEQKNWEQRLINAKDFAKQYNEIMSNLSVASNEGAISTVGGNSGMTTSDLNALTQAKIDFDSATTQAEKDAAHAKAEAIRNKYGYSGGADGSQYIPISSSSSGSSKSSSSSSSKNAVSTVKTIMSKVGSAISKSLSKHADGTLSATGGLSLVGENGPELRVLGNNDGIIPADITRNLWDWGKINPATSGIGNSSYVFNIDTLSLPNATNAQTLVDGLKQMAYQRAYKRA